MFGRTNGTEWTVPLNFSPKNDSLYHVKLTEKSSQRDKNQLISVQFSRQTIPFSHLTGRSSNSLPDNKILDLYKTKAFADDKVNVSQILIFVIVNAEDVVGKGENACCQHFLLFPKCFQ